MTDELPPVTAPDGIALPTLPDHWQWASLEQLLERIEAGKSFRCNERPPNESEHGVVKVSAVTWGTYDEQESKTITDAGRIDEAYLIRPGDFLFSRANTIQLVGASVIVHSTSKRLLLSDKILRLVFAYDVKQWVNWLFKSKIGRKQIEALSTGNQESMRNIGQQRIGQICVPIAPPKEMQRIVSKIDELFSRIDEGERALERVQKLVERYRQSVLKAAVTGELTRDWREKNKDQLESGEALLARILKARREAWEKAELDKMKAKGITPANDKWKQKYEEPAAPDTTNLPELPEGWTWVSMDQLLVRIEAGKSFRCDERPPNGDEYGLVKVSAVTWGTYDEHESKTITDVDRIFDSYLIRENDFLFSRANTIQLVGASVIVRSVTKRLLLSDKILRFVFAVDLKEWVDIFLKSQLGRAQIEALSSGNQESMRNIGQERISRIAVPLPPEAEIQASVDHISSELQRARMVFEGCQQESRRAQATRQSVLKAAFSGVLVPQDSHDEPAAALLARIAAERNNAPATPKRGRKPKTSEPA